MDFEFLETSHAPEVHLSLLLLKGKLRLLQELSCFGLELCNDDLGLTLDLESLGLTLGLSLGLTSSLNGFDLSL